MPKTKLLLPLTALLIAILVIAACGGNTPSPSTEEGQGDGDPLPTHQPGESEWSPPTGEGDSPTPIPPAPEQPWPQPDLQTPLPILNLETPTPVPTPEFDPAAYFAQLRPLRQEPLAHRLLQALHRLHRNPPRPGSRRDSVYRQPQVRTRVRRPRLARRKGARYRPTNRRRRPCLPPSDHDLARDRQRHRRRRARHRHLLPPLQLRHRLRTPHGRHRQLLRRQRPPPLQRPHHVRPGHRQLVAADSRRGYRRRSHRRPAPQGPCVDHLLGRLPPKLPRRPGPHPGHGLYPRVRAQPLHRL